MYPSNALLVEKDLCSVNLEEDLDMSSSSCDQESTELSTETVRSTLQQDDWDLKEHSYDERDNGRRPNLNLRSRARSANRMRTNARAARAIDSVPKDTKDEKMISSTCYK